MITSRNAHYSHRIPGLLIPRRADFKLLDKNINRYIDIAQALTEEIQKALEEAKQNDLVENLEKAYTILSYVYARYLSSEAAAILRCLKYPNMPNVMERIPPLVANMLALSIEMQKAQQRTADGDVGAPSELEEHVGIVHNLEAVATMIGDGAYEQAQSLVTDMEDYNPEIVLERMIALLSEKKYEEASLLAQEVKENHVEAIKSFATATDTMVQKTILAVDDKPEILANVIAALKGRYKVFGLTSGKAALDFLESKTPDLFILDIEMPGMDGYQLTEAIRGINKFNKTPIIFLTGNSSRSSVQRVIDVGGNDFVVKPASHEMLLTKIGKYLH
jgi:CheY-like chemotaxis protein